MDICAITDMKNPSNQAHHHYHQRERTQEHFSSLQGRQFLQLFIREFGAPCGSTTTHTSCESKCIFLLVMPIPALGSVFSTFFFFVELPEKSPGYRDECRDLPRRRFWQCQNTRHSSPVWKHEYRGIHSSPCCRNVCNAVQRSLAGKPPTNTTSHHLVVLYWMRIFFSCWAIWSSPLFVNE